MLGYVRYVTALVVGKAARAALRLIGKNGTQLPGRIALKIAPDFLARVPKPEKIVGITGTNGKTTSVNLALGALTELGYDLLSNRLGSNTWEGIATSLLSNASFSGKSRKNFALLEIDERSSLRIYPYVHPDYLVCTNLVRDSIHRNAHAEYIFDIINQSLPKKTKLILNADDGISSQLGVDSGHARSYFGIKNPPNASEHERNIVNDLRLCPKCFNKLTYTWVLHNHIGRFHCSDCSYASPEPSVTASIDMSSYTLTVSSPQGEETSNLVSPEIYNCYNQTAVIALLLELGVPLTQAMSAVAHQDIVKTRHSSIISAGVKVTTNVAKGMNPVACSWVFHQVCQAQGTKEVVLLLDDIFDAKYSSEYICWIYDADFEFLRHPDIKKIVVGGVRNLDYRVRLLLAGIDPERIVCVEDELSTSEAVSLDCEQIFILHDIYRSAQAKTVAQAIAARLEKKKTREEANS